MSKIRRFLRRLKAIAYATFNRTPVAMTIIRRYLDAKGNFIGELYLHDGDKPAYMIGMSCDTYPFEAEGVLYPIIDTDNDFLVPMPEFMLRVGAMTPDENDRIRDQIDMFRYRVVQVNVQNRFCETVLAGRHNV